MAGPAVLVGAGGHGRELLDIAEAAGVEILGFLDDGAPDPGPIAGRGRQILGPVQHLAALDPHVGFVIAVGDALVRLRLAHLLADHDRPSPALLHPLSSQGSGCSIGPGAVMAAGSRLTTEVRLDDHAYVGANAVIGHDGVIGRCANVFPGAVLSGACTVGEAAMIGAGAVVVQGVTIGDRARIGAGAVVLGDVPPDAVVVGVRARDPR